MAHGSNRITGFQEKPKGLEKTAMSMDWEDLDDFLDSGTAATMEKKQKHGEEGSVIVCMGGRRSACSDDASGTRKNNLLSWTFTVGVHTCTIHMMEEVCGRSIVYHSSSAL